MKPPVSSCFLLGTTLLFFLVQPIFPATFSIANGDVAGLISALNSANTNGQDDTINLAVFGTYVLTAVYDTTQGPSGTPVLIQDGTGTTFHRITINANGSTIMRSTAAGTPPFRLFTDHTLAVPNFFFTINNATLKNGDAGTSLGGAIFANGRVVLNDCILEDNAAASGGAVANQARLVQLNRCTLANNTVTGEGGGVYNDSGEVDLTNCTVAANSSGAHGDGVMTVGRTTGASTGIFGCTFSENEVANFELPLIAQVSMFNTILSNSPIYSPSINSSFSQVMSTGYNLSTDNGNGRLTATGDQINTDPKLDPGGLLFNGGPTKTIALTFGSPAIDKGAGFGLTTDQRGAVRPLDNPGIANASGGDGSDIGAYEAPSDPIQSGVPSFIVTTINDHNDGNCGGTDCTLREALQKTNARPGANTITFAPAVVGTITMDSALGDLAIIDSTTIIGPGARVLAISANTQGRVFTVGAGASSLSGLTIRDGFVAGGNPGTSNTAGGIENFASLSLNDCHIRNNRVLGVAATAAGATGGSANGGAVFNSGELAVNRCTFRDNHCFGGAGAANPHGRGGTTTGGTGGAGRGAAIFNDTGRTLNVQHSTFFNNQTGGGDGGAGDNGGAGGNAKGAIYNLGTASVIACTLSGNAASGGDGGPGVNVFFNGVPGSATGGLSAAGGTFTLSETISAGNPGIGGADAEGSFVSLGYNLIGDASFSSGFSSMGDQVGTTAAPLNARLGPLQNNGGGTDTMAPLVVSPASPAIDKGKNPGSATDQRGLPRTINSSVFTDAAGGDGTDIGAVEFYPLTGTDTDGDGMSDDFEIYYGFNPNDLTDGPLDADGDGLTNAQEFAAGTNPLDPKSGLRVIAVLRNGNNFVVTFSLAVVSKTYRLERKDALSEAMWSSINGVNDFSPTSTSSAQITDPGGATTTKHFYHVRLLP